MFLLVIIEVVLVLGNHTFTTQKRILEDKGITGGLRHISAISQNSLWNHI